MDSKCKKHCWVILRGDSCKQIEQGISGTEQGMSGIHSCCMVRVAIEIWNLFRHLSRSSMVCRPSPTGGGNFSNISYIDHPIDSCKCKYFK